MPANIKLGIGDPTKFNLLGGSFGEAGDVVTGNGGYGARFFPSAKTRILQAAYSSGAAYSGGAPSGGGGRGPGGSAGLPRPVER